MPKPCPDVPTRAKWNRSRLLETTLIAACLLLLVGILIPAIGAHSRLYWRGPSPIIALLTGWYRYPLILAARWRVDVDQLVSALLTLALLLVLSHSFFRWLRRARAATASATPWRWRSTVLLALLVFTVFTSTITATMALHQGYWVLSGRNRVVEQHYGRLPMTTPQCLETLSFLMAGAHPDDGLWAIGPLYCLRDEFRPEVQFPLEFIDIRDEQQHRRAFIAVPRDPAERAQLGVYSLVMGHEKGQVSHDQPVHEIYDALVQRVRALPLLTAEPRGNRN